LRLIREEEELEMLRIDRILCPTDLSTESDEALRYAVALTRAYEANLLLLHCTEIKSQNSQSESRHLSVDIARAFEQALINYLGLVELCNLKWEALAIDNVQDIGQAIAHQAAKHNADLIVMRSRRRPHAAVLLGSTAETVSRMAPCPVLVTHPGEREWVGLSTGEIDLHRVLVAHDFSPDSERALNYGISLAQEYQAEMHLLHVISNEEQEEPEVAWSHVGVQSLYTSAARQLQQAVPKEALLWCSLVTVVRCGGAYEEVLAYAKEHEIDLICMGASGTNFSLGKLLGSTVDRVLRQAPCPVFVARPVKSAAVCAGAANA
jgi:nucleotide-binding universal stress UspA family protein